MNILKNCVIKNAVFFDRCLEHLNIYLKSLVNICVQKGVPDEST